MSIVVEREIAGRILRIETGKVAKQAAGAVTVRYADTVVLVAVTTDKPRETEEEGFLPMTVDYREKGYAAGMIFGGRFYRREGRPTEKEILTMRLIDRPIRPLFPSTFLDEVLISAIVLSADLDNDPDILAMIGTSAALAISPLPFLGPVSACRIGMIDGALVANPTHAQEATSTLNLVIAGKKDGIVMVEAGAKELPEKDMVAALDKGQEINSAVCKMIDELVAKVAPEKIRPAVDPVPPLADRLLGKYEKAVAKALVTPGKFGRKAALSAVKDAFMKAEAAADEDDTGGKPAQAVASMVFSEIHYRTIRKMILEGTRVDGRKHDEVREISIEVATLPRVHGSALFTRGETQALVTTTLGTADDEQLHETLVGERVERFMLHYNFPSFSVGETKMPRGPSRREIGHGALARRALEAVVPSFAEFPYTVRVVSDVLESNGSSSMATVCGGSLALMDAGVPIKAAVAGVAMGLIKEGNSVAVLTDILGDEDHFGDMDFKVAGTSVGVTALQMDIKVPGITSAVMMKALTQAATARLQILGRMNAVLEAPRPEIAENAPKIVQIMIPPDKIGKVIGPGGAMIKAIQAETGTEISIEDDGTVCIYGPDKASAEAAQKKVEALTEAPVIGKTYQGKVRTIKDFGVFVEIIPGVDGLVHVSELSSQYVENVYDAVKVGDTFPVKLLSIDDQGRLRLSRRAAEAEIAGLPYEETPAPSSRGGDRPRRGGGGGHDRGDRGRGHDRDREHRE